MKRRKAAILGSGNIGTDLLIKAQSSSTLEVGLMVGIDRASEGLARARSLGVETSHLGMDGLLAWSGFEDVEVVFDATSAKAHLGHARVLAEVGKPVVDLTPAAVGPFVVPVANLEAHLGAPNVNMVTCGGQATIPVVWALSQVARVHYAEIVASIASRSAGPGTRANIDEFTVTTARAIETVGGAESGKAIIILNPAEPPIIMRDTVYAFCGPAEDGVLVEAVEEIVRRVREYVPGYRLVQAPVVENRAEAPLLRPGREPVAGKQVTVLLEVEGAGDYLPSYAGNLDIMTAAALRVGELIAEGRAR